MSVQLQALCDLTSVAVSSRLQWQTGNRSDWSVPQIPTHMSTHITQQASCAKTVPAYLFPSLFHISTYTCYLFLLLSNPIILYEQNNSRPKEKRSIEHCQNFSCHFSQLILALVAAEGVVQLRFGNEGGVGRISGSDEHAPVREWR